MTVTALTVDINATHLRMGKEVDGGGGGGDERGGGEVGGVVVLPPLARCQHVAHIKSTTSTDVQRRRTYIIVYQSHTNL